MDVTITLNGARRRVGCEPGETLLALLRREGCFSVRFGSGTGETGAAGVLLDGRIVSADVLLAAQADGHEVTTVESLNVATGELHPIQEAFVEAGALQSGYSAGAMILATKALLERNPDPDEREIADALSGILDRETGYVKVVAGVRRAAALLRGEKPAPVQPVIVEPLAGRDSAPGPSPAPEQPPAADHGPWPAVPAVVRSPEVAPTLVVGQPAPKVDALRWSRATRRSPTTWSCAGCCTRRCCEARTRTPASSRSTMPRPGPCPACTRCCTASTRAA